MTIEGLTIYLLAGWLLLLLLWLADTLLERAEQRARRDRQRAEQRAERDRWRV